MKKLSLIAIILALSSLLFSCKGNEKPDESEKIEDTTELTDTTEIAEPSLIDFSSVEVSGYLFAKEGETLSLSDENITADAYASSKPSVATVSESGEITAIKKGVTLIGTKSGKNESATVLCVFGEGESRDRSAGTPLLFESGESYTLTATVAVTEYLSSNESIADISNAPEILFKDCGYAVITASNVSRPFFYSFIVYDRTAE